MKQNGKARSGRSVVGPATPALASTEELRWRLAALDERLADVQAAVEQLQLCLAEISPLREALAAAVETPAEAPTGDTPPVEGQAHVPEPAENGTEPGAELPDAVSGIPPEAPADAPEDGESPPPEVEAVVTEDEVCQAPESVVEAPPERDGPEPPEPEGVVSDAGSEEPAAEDDPDRPLTPEELRRLVAEFQQGRVDAGEASAASGIPLEAPADAAADSESPPPDVEAVVAEADEGREAPESVMEAPPERDEQAQPEAEGVAAEAEDEEPAAAADDPNRPLTPEELRRLVAEFQEGRADAVEASAASEPVEAGEPEPLLARAEAAPVGADEESTAAAEDAGGPLTQEEISRLVAGFRDDGSRDEPAEQTPEREPERVTEAVEQRLHAMAHVPIRVSIEDKRNGVTLVPLHRALLGIPGVTEASLMSYASGKIIVSVVAAGELDGPIVERALSRALGRRCEIAFQDDRNLFIRMSED